MLKSSSQGLHIVGFRHVGSFFYSCSEWWFCFVLLFCTGDDVVGLQPSGESSEVFVVDVAVGVDFLAAVAVAGKVVGVVVVDAVEGYAVMEQPVDGVEQVLPCAASPDDDVVPVGVKLPDGVGGVGCLPVDEGEAGGTADGAVKVNGDYHRVRWLRFL